MIRKSRSIHTRILAAAFCVLIIGSLGATVLVGQPSNIEEVLRHHGIWGYDYTSTVRATQYGVATALTVHDTTGRRLRYRSTVITITEGGIDTITLGNNRCAQAVLWRDTVFAALFSARDTVFLAAALVNGNQRAYVMPGSWNLGTNIQCLDGSVTLFDIHRGVTFLLHQNDTLRQPLTLYDDDQHLEMCSIHGDIYVFPAFEPTKYMRSGTRRFIELDTMIKDSTYKRPYHNLSFIGDSIVWVDVKSRRWALSKITRDYRVTIYDNAGERIHGGCAGRWGYLDVSVFDSNPYNDAEVTNKIVVRYTHGNGRFLRDTIHLPNIHRSGLGVGYWNGAFYFTAEVRDSGAPIETATTIIYKYTEPVPAVSVEDHRPEPTTREITEHLALSQEAFATWLAGLGPDVSVFDLLGKDTSSAPPRPGVFCVTSAGRRWIVLCY